MSETQEPKGSQLLTFLGSLGAILIFALILFVAYLPNRAEPVDAQRNADRQTKADESRAAGTNKITSLEVIDATSGKVRIPVKDAMQYIVDSYGTTEAVAAEPEVAEAVAEEVPAVEDIVEAVEEAPAVEELAPEAKEAEAH